MNIIEKVIENDQGIVESEALIVIGNGKYKEMENMEIIHFNDRVTGLIIPQIRINFLQTFMHNEDQNFKRIYLS